MTEKKDDDEDAAECLSKHRAQRLCCEATTSESQRLQQAGVTHDACEFVTKTRQEEGSWAGDGR